MLLFLPAPFFPSSGSCRTQAPLPEQIFKAPRPHLTSYNEATLLPCPGLCEAHKRLLTGLCVSRWAGGVSQDPPQGSALDPLVFTLSPNSVGDTAGGHFQMMQSSLQPRTTGPKLIRIELIRKM